MNSIQTKISKDTATIMLHGEIDHYTAQGIRTQIESLIKCSDVRHMRLDFSDVSFMDSSGIGMIIGRYKTMAAKNGTVSACGLMPPIERLFRMAGLHRIIAIECDAKGENT